jgi:hypothetical protein
MQAVEIVLNSLHPHSFLSQPHRRSSATLSLQERGKREEDIF